jgi:hypothetical protein
MQRINELILLTLKVRREEEEREERKRVQTERYCSKL